MVSSLVIGEKVVRTNPLAKGIMPTFGTHPFASSIARDTNLMVGHDELLLLEQKYLSLMHYWGSGRVVSYAGNKNIPFLRLYRYKEAFSFGLVEYWLACLRVSKKDVVLDPFCGIGTTLFASSCNGIKAIGIDSLPVATFVARVFPLFFRLRSGEISGRFKQLYPKVHLQKPAPIPEIPLIKKAFAPDILLSLCQWKSAIDALDFPHKDIFTFLLLASLDNCSNMCDEGKFLSGRKRGKPVSPEEALAKRVQEVEEDLQRVRMLGWDKCFVPYVVLEGDARRLDNNLPWIPTVVITSPPYANQYDYVQNRLRELCFGFVRSREDIEAIRGRLVRSYQGAKILPDDHLVHPAIKEIAEHLESNGIPNAHQIKEMLVGYFADLLMCIREWSKILPVGAHAVVVVGNVRYGGMVVPVDLILCDLAKQEGWETQKIVVARYKGNSSQQMKRYKRIPVRESILVWRKV